MRFLLPLLVLLAGAVPAQAEISPRIVGGTPATQAYPAQAEVDISLGPIQELCGGTLIDPQWVLTAEHCVLNDTLFGAQQLPASAFTVKLGSATLDQGTPYAVDGVAPEAGFDFRSLNNDAALLHLSTAAPQEPLALLDDATLPAAVAGAPARVIGWGYTAEDGAVSQTLNEVNIPIQSDDACRQAYGDGINTDTMLCAGYPAGGKDACNGDSGGPLMVVAGNRLALAGIVSFGQGCAEANAYGVYTRIANAGLRSWVASLVPSVQEAQARGAEQATRKATLAAATCGGRACHVTVTFATSGSAHARVRISQARRAALGLSDRTVATRTEAVTGTRRLKLAIPSATRRKLARARAHRIPAAMTVRTLSATGVAALQKIAVRVRGSR